MTGRGRVSKLQSMPTAAGGAKVGGASAPALMSARLVQAPTSPMRASLLDEPRCSRWIAPTVSLPGLPSTASFSFRT